jgi:hemerythrin superfamily protein
MVSNLTDAKRAAIAEKLASMKAIQNLLIANEQQFIQETTDSDIRNRLNDMLSDDQKNLGILDTTITQYGIQSEPKETVRKFVEQAQQMMQSSELSFYEKVAQHELLKHGQVMSGLVIHKAGQVVGADVEAAIAPLNTVNFENRAHQEQLKGILEVLGTRELTGQEPDQGIWARVQDTVAAMTGVLGSAVTQTSDKSDMNVQDVIRMDHQKAKTLMGEILNSNSPSKIEEYFGQLYKDLTAHAEAEEQVVYPAVRPFYGDKDTQELYDEQAQQKQLLQDIKATSSSSPEFKDKIRRLRDITMDHIRQEESTMFAAIRNNCSSAQQEQMATQFKEAKKQLQTKMA